MSTGSYIQAIVRDITERKKAEKGLQDALAEIRKLTELVEAENVYLRHEIRMAHLHGDIVAQSEPMKEVMAQAEQVAPTDSTVLILGETDTGKELLARAIHNMSTRSERQLVVVNCAAMPPTLIWLTACVKTYRAGAVFGPPSSSRTCGPEPRRSRSPGP